MEPNFRSAVFAVRVLYAALIVSLLIFAAVLVFSSMVETGIATGNDLTGQILLAVFSFLGIVLIWTGFSLYKKKMKGIEDHKIEERIRRFRTAMILRAVTQEATVFMFIIGYMITSSLYFVIGAGVALLFLLYHFPGKNTISREVKFDPS